MQHFPPSLLPDFVTDDIVDARRVTLIDEFDTAGEPEHVEAPTRTSIRLRFDADLAFAQGAATVVYDAESVEGTIRVVTRTGDETTVTFQL